MATRDLATFLRRLAVFAVLTAVFLMAPILAIVPLGFSDGEFLVYPVRGWSLKWFEAFFASEKWAIGVQNSFLIGAVSALIATVLGNVIQLASKKFWGRKVFLVAPIHHHFEAIGWPADKVVMRYWVIGIIMAIVGVVITLVGR